MRRTARVFAIAVLIAMLAWMLAGCAASEPATEQPTQTQPADAAPGVELAGTSWNCLTFGVAGRTLTPLADAPITAVFGDDGTLSGSAGVNTYTTSYETDGSGITIGQNVVTTKMAGPQEAMDLEADYLATLVTAVSYQVDEKSGQLVLFGPADNTVARYNPAE